MQVKMAKTAGACMGVTRALNMAVRAAEQGAPQPIVTLGPLIHNNQAVQALADRGVGVADSVDEITSGTVLIRAHGVTPGVKEVLSSRSVNVIDATCPNVVRNQRSIAEWTAKGYSAIVVGDLQHAEITGLLGHAEGPPPPEAEGYREPVVISSVAELEKLELPRRVVVIAQTTFSSARYAEIVDAVRSRRPAAVVFESICASTADRQEEIAELAAECDAVVVVGGRHSANTLRLAEISRSSGVPTFHVEEAEELREEEFRGMKVVGVTAGASTPAWVTEEVADRLALMDPDGGGT